MDQAGTQSEDGGRFRLRRLGRILVPPADHPQWISHAQAPTVLPLSPDLWMAFFAGRDRHNMSRVFAAEIDPGDFSVRRLHERPALDIGAAGAFDEHGVGAGTAIRDGDRIRLYYSGGQRRPDVPYRVCIGLAVSEDGGRSFSRVGSEPVVGISPENPLGITSPTVIRDGDGWRMWYSSFRDWRRVGEHVDPVYDLRGAHSPDGLRWTPEDAPALGYEGAVKGGLIRANFFETARGPRMIAAERGWRDFRAGEGSGYRFVIARPDEGGRWRRSDEPVTLDPPPAAEDWDSDMWCYPWLVQQNGRRFVFYNGNDFGRHGFGVAELIEDGAEEGAA